MNANLTEYTGQLGGNSKGNFGQYQSQNTILST